MSRSQSQSSAISRFIADVASTLEYDSETLFMEVELRGVGGPTVGPSTSSGDHILKTVTVDHAGKAAGGSVPSAEYDTLANRHVEYRLYRRDTEMSEMIFAFQLLPLPGHCGLCVVRWVRHCDSTSWPKDLLLRALRFRMEIARLNAYAVMTISTGPSFSGGEQVEEFNDGFTGYNYRYGVNSKRPIHVKWIDLGPVWRNEGNLYI